MKLLYAAYRHDPRNPDLASGADYNYYSAMLRNGFEVDVVGPIAETSLPVERAIKRLYERFSKYRFSKFHLSGAWAASKALNEAERHGHADAIFSIFPPPLVFYKGVMPCIYRLDTTFIAWNRQYPEFGDWAMKMLVWMEKRAFSKATRIITQSEWCKHSLITDYGVPAWKIEVLANPSALPDHVIPAKIQVREDKQLGNTLRLLFVGRDQKRKGLDIAIDIVEQLNAQGVSTRLTVCGQSGEDTEHICYMGMLKKSKPEELQRYVDCYRTAHLLLHPARFDPSPIVTSEAAAFGTPTISNGVGGIATSVADGLSGIVLPVLSQPEAYVQAIKALIRAPEAYYSLCESTRARYERELNWDVAGKRVAGIISDVITGQRSA